jgi:hypothetical protein
VRAQALFRLCSMMIPDYALVAEVMLFSEGFEDSKALSRKMVKLYKLASEQLSQQDHYDFGELTRCQCLVCTTGIVSSQQQQVAAGAMQLSWQLFMAGVSAQ